MTTDDTPQDPAPIISDAGSGPGPGSTPEVKSETALYERRIRRVRLLNEELDRLATDATARAGGVANKASFLAVSAGVLITAAAAQTWHTVPVWGVAALVMATVALAAAAIALRPGTRPGVEARRLIDRHLHCDHRDSDVEVELVRDKAEVLTAYERDIAGRSVWVWGGFGALALASASLVAVFAYETLGG